MKNLNDEFKLPQISDLIASKTEEKVAPEGLDWNFHAAELDRLLGKLDQAFEATTISEDRDRAAVNDLLIDLRMSASGADKVTDH